EVLDQQPEPLRRFLLESAVLPEMEPQVCDEVLGRRDSAELLRLAESHRLFVSAIGEENRAYQYHHLFRDFLQKQLAAHDPPRPRAPAPPQPPARAGAGLAPRDGLAGGRPPLLRPAGRVSARSPPGGGAGPPHVRHRPPGHAQPLGGATGAGGARSPAPAPD